MLHRATQFRTIATTVAVAALAAAAFPAAATASPAPAPSTAAQRLSPVAKIEDQVARDLARSLSDSAWRTTLDKAAANGKEVGLQGLATSAGLSSSLAAADRAVLEAKGLPATTGPLLTVSLVGSTAKQSPLVAYAPSDDDATTVTAYDSSGKAYALDATKAPTRPVYVVGLDEDKAVSAGLKVLDSTLAAQGVGSAAEATRATAATDGFWTSRITSVRLNDDMETWIRGDAEIFSIVSGFGLDGKVRVDTVDMPYLNEEDTTYSPYQILVNWSSYKYDLADVVMYEDDGDTNYSALAIALATALLTIVDQGTYIPLVSPIINAMPASWWTDDPDYVDSWYTLATTTTGTRVGAGGNGTFTFDRYWVGAL